MSYVDEKTVEVGRAYQFPGLTAALRVDDVKGQMLLPWYAAPGDGGLESRMESDLRADMADV